MTKALIFNEKSGRYELEEGGYTAFARCRREGNQLVIEHVEAPPELRGTGAAGRLMQGVVAAAKAEGLEIVPLCGYAATWLRRNGI